MRRILFLLLATSAVPAFAAGPPYEGMYDVALALKPGLDAPTCPAVSVQTLKVEKGQITGQQTISGKLNEKGQLTGQLRLPDGTLVAFSGFVQPYEYDTGHTHVNATIVDNKTGCGWSLALTGH